MKKKILNKKYLIVLFYFFILVFVNVYVRSEYEKIELNISKFIIHGKENHDELLSNTKNVVSYERLLTFYPGLDNDIVYTPAVTVNPNGSTTNTIDESKLSWNDLKAFERDFIYTTKASTCNEKINKDEIVIKLSHLQDNVSKFLNKDISFKYNGELINFKIKQINSSKYYSFVCIADELYDELLEKEENYIYDVKFDSYKNLQKYREKWLKLENNDFYGLSVSSYSSIDIQSKENKLNDFIDFLNYLNVISALLFLILVIVFIVKLLLNKLNKEMGDNN